MAIGLTDSSGRSVSRPVVERKGSILIIALWSLCLLSTFAVNLGYGVRQKIMVVKRLEEREKLYLIAEAGAKRAINELETMEQKDYDTLTDEWSNGADIFKDITVGEGAYSVSYDYINELTGLPETGYGLVDEERKININKVELDMLERLLRIVLDLGEMQAQELAASIIDWRDGDSGLSIPLGSAEDSYYRYLSTPYEAKDSDFEVLEEVLLVKGMEEDIFERLKDYITIYGDGKININTASRPVLLTLGLNETIVNYIMQFRYGEDVIIGTADDKIFDLPSNVVPMLSQSYSLSDQEIAQLSVVVERYLTTKSNNFMVRSIASMDKRKDTVEVNCVVDKKGKILRWQGL